jgi:hypothetical protein
MCFRGDEINDLLTFLWYMLRPPSPTLQKGGQKFPAQTLLRPSSRMRYVVITPAMAAVSFNVTPKP